MRLPNGLVLTIESNEGELFRKKERLNLEGDVILRTSDGYRADAQRLKINMKKRVAIVPAMSLQPVRAAASRPIV